jgi:hypothetical protein
MNCECDCPICLDAIIGTTNKTTTECGHHFHTKCLMQNAIHNGFGCPYCRNILAETPLTDDEDEESERDDDSFLEEEEAHEDYILRGVRWFNQRNNNEEMDNDGLDDENAEVNLEEEEEQEPMESLENVNIKFKSVGITYEELVGYVLSDYMGHYEDNLTNNNSYKKIYTKLREIDANFKKELKNNNRVENNNDFEIVHEYQIPSNNI